MTVAHMREFDLFLNRNDSPHFLFEFQVLEPFDFIYQGKMGVKYKKGNKMK